jgi:hypothetical protein
MEYWVGAVNLRRKVPTLVDMAIANSGGLKSPSARRVSSRELSLGPPRSHRRCRCCRSEQGTPPAMPGRRDTGLRLAHRSTRPWRGHWSLRHIDVVAEELHHEVVLA